MKNLVMRILNGTFAPVPSDLSDELRQLISEMLIKDAFLRPSIKKILQKEFLSVKLCCLISQHILKNRIVSVNY